ncbi:SHOCT domain-containing protein [Paenibacillus sp. MMS20-IR301]|uniref:SHOCT domain-containing protein n=1 Tax=Paenibacillus sp. MMS20-IR301 TaxID=2895946 RepID=UPI0028EBBBB0|nr:SHOCT domain-containing protein [Paenibacillus sp. MMS20-IR301]WNS45352.1 SHOCT domain-containing protein [Paenibacillus sp. MMS20-IR301]
MTNEQQSGQGTMEVLLANAVKLPGVQVNRNEFLAQQLAKYDTYGNMPVILEKGPLEAGIGLQVIDKLAKSLIEKRTILSTAASTVAGIPGGLAMAATIPGDTLQYFGVAMRMSQELAYLYGRSDLWQDSTPDSEQISRELTLYLGVMFGVAGAAPMLRILNAPNSRYLLQQHPQLNLAESLYFPLLKKISSYIGIKITKRTFTQGATKFIPLLGGLLSGGMTYLSMKPMGNRLRETLAEAVDRYTEAEFAQDLEKVQRAVEDADIHVAEGEFFDLGFDSKPEPSAPKAAAPAPEKFSAADELLKFKQLLDMGVITQEEFDRKKAELLNS